MDFWEQITSNDSIIKRIELYGEKAKLFCEKWNAEHIVYVIQDYYMITDYQSVNQDIGEITVNYKSETIDKIRGDVLLGGGNGTECDGLMHIVFYNATDEYVILEIVATAVTIEE